MAEYGIYQAKTRLAELIKSVRRGERVTITNRGEPVADLVPSVAHARRQTEEAIAAIKAARSGRIDQARFDEMRRRGRR